MKSEAAAVARTELRFPSGDAECGAWLYRPPGPGRAPLVVLGHGVGARREMRLDAYAERFAGAGIAALAFTYRHFGDSGGSPRQLLSIRRQLADWEAAIAYGRGLDGVDGARLALWGSSFGGGHALTVGARHPELRAVVIQCPFTSGPASAWALGARASLKLTPRVVADLAAAVAGRPPVTVPIAAPPGEAALMNAADALPGYLALMPPEIEFDNRVAARIVPSLLAYRPGRRAAAIRSPLLVCVSDTDSVAPPGPTLAAARRAPRGEVRRYPAGHFDFYLGAAFERLVADQVAFLGRHLDAERP